ncbi:Pyridoxamine 5'-phosphate oxidase [compost metagenome]
MGYDGGMTDTLDRGPAARHLLHSQRHGVLATISLDLPGYPFGSITPYVVDHGGEPLILISTLAQHTKNLLADPRMSLTVHDAENPDVQAAARLTWVGQAEKVADTDAGARERYMRYFPDAEGYFEAHDFHLYRLKLVRARFIGGFGRIYWLEPHEVLQANPFAETEVGIVSHMNEDHGHNLLAYCRSLQGIQAEEAVMLGIDAEGFDVRADERRVRFTFEAPIATPEEARAALVKMARRAATSQA